MARMVPVCRICGGATAPRYVNVRPKRDDGKRLSRSSSRGERTRWRYGVYNAGRNGAHPGLLDRGVGDAPVPACATRPSTRSVLW